MYSLATQPPMAPTIRNNNVRKDPKTKLIANMSRPPILSVVICNGLALVLPPVKMNSNPRSIL